MKEHFGILFVLLSPVKELTSHAWNARRKEEITALVRRTGVMQLYTSCHAEQAQESREQQYRQISSTQIVAVDIRDSRLIRLSQFQSPHRLDKTDRLSHPNHTPKRPSVPPARREPCSNCTAAPLTTSGFSVSVVAANSRPRPQPTSAVPHARIIILVVQEIQVSRVAARSIILQKHGSASQRSVRMRGNAKLARFLLVPEPVFRCWVTRTRTIAVLRFPGDFFFFGFWHLLSRVGAILCGLQI